MYDEVERERYILEPDILELAAFESWRDRDVLEAGCGIATDGAQFARAGRPLHGGRLQPDGVAPRAASGLRSTGSRDGSSPRR